MDLKQMDEKKRSFSVFWLDRLYARTLAYVPLHEIKLYDEKKWDEPIVANADREKFVRAQNEMKAALPLVIDFRKRLAVLFTGSPDFKNAERLYYSLKTTLNSWTESWVSQCHHYCSQVLRKKLERELANIDASATLVQIGIDEYAISPALTPEKQDAFCSKFDDQKEAIRMEFTNAPHEKLIHRIQSALHITN